ncbi:205a80d9-7c57-4702-bc4f-138470d155a5 [Sclerotinia trifoliorum]|uniref:205a80d9-7c57-4702-bc4f-138470d155a5 n=1 Tax=Sclerotinia trifoliorum TaxID=28548 RepID=A0A8H2ZP39_9HELO|nr:205a80d9-7c57-4702-bc4f-138470d155a5 [Sclerotinia trifoliorum]
MMMFWLQVLGAAVIGVYVVWKIQSKYWMSRRNEAKSHFNNEKASDSIDSQTIVPLTDFDWRTTEPLKIRPFKPIYHMTMGLQSCSPSEFIEMDRTYLDRLTVRTNTIRAHTPTVLQALPSSHAAIQELYTYLTATYLPTRFPTIYALTPTYLLNKATSHHIPLHPSSPLEALHELGTNVDTEFLLLVPSPDGDGYMLAGFIACFPSGFDTQSLLGKKIRDIHKPVPRYKEKLETSMYRSFDRLEVGKIVKRVNWSITTHSRLFAPSGNHLYEGEEAKPEEFDINDTHLRCERQLVHRLPQTKALVFSFKTYLTPLAQVKEEGLGEELAEAIDGLRKGSVPEIHYYKRGVVWGEKVKQYLRS